MARRPSEIPAEKSGPFGADRSRCFRSFLPPPDPLTSLPSAFAAWNELGAELPRTIAAGRSRMEIARLPLLDPAPLADGPELERAMMLLSFFGHAYLWDGDRPAERFPENLARPWAAVAARSGRPPVLSYASYALANYRRFDPTAPHALGNLALLQNFCAGVDEDWFILIHVAIEAAAAPGISRIAEAQSAIRRGDDESLASHLEEVGASIEAMCELLSRMPERCDPYIYFRRVRPFIHGFRDHPALPDGVVFEGVERFGGRPQRFRGETGAQSSIVPCFDALLGIAHREDPLRAYLDEMREYMPPRHRAFIEACEAGPDVATHLRSDSRSTSVARAQERCVEALRRFRSQHLVFAETYIHRQSGATPGNPSAVGTGGTPFMPYLKKHRDETHSRSG